MYTYSATILRVVDGDTVDIELDLGFDIRTVQRVRMAGINAPEKNTEAGMQSKIWLTDKLKLGQKVTVRSEKPGGGDKYGRYLAWIVDGSCGDRTVNELIISAGHALAWDGSGVKPV